jgi:hypothetical protein
VSAGAFDAQQGLVDAAGQELGLHRAVAAGAQQFLHEGVAVIDRL